MNSKRLYYILLATVLLMTGGLVGGAYGANMLLQAQAKKLVDARSVAQALDTQQGQLNKAKTDVAKYTDISEIARSVVPQDKSQAQTVRELVAIAGQNNIKLTSITFPSSTLGGVGGAAGAAGSSASGPNLSQLQPVKTISGVYNMRIAVQSDAQNPIDYDKFTSFLTDLEHNRRTALVSSINITPNAKDSTKVSFTLNIDEYIKP